MASPGVREEALERGRDLVGDPPRRLGPLDVHPGEVGAAAAGDGTCLDLLRAGGEGRDLPVGHAGDVLADRPGQPDARREVDLGVDDRVDEEVDGAQVGRR